MFEVEVKVRADHEAVRARLTDVGATPQGRVVQVDTYFDAPHREFADTDEALRIRRESSEGSRGDDGSESQARLTYKGPLVEAESKTREEVEADVVDGSGDDVAAILESLGFSPAATVRKERERFGYDGYTVTLDAVDAAGEFVEVETTVEAEADVPAGREGAFAVLRDLGLDPDEQIQTSYLGMVLDDADG